MAPLNFKKLSISVSNADITAKVDSKAKPGAAGKLFPICKAESEAKPNSTPHRGLWLGTIIPAAPIYPSDFTLTPPLTCSPTSPIPAMASMSVSLSLVASTPTESEAPPAPPAKVSYPAQLFDMVHHHFFYELCEPCKQFLRDPPPSKRLLDAKHQELSDALSLGVLYELVTLDTQGDATLHNKRKSLARVVKDMMLMLDEVVMQEHAVHEKMAAEYRDEMVKVAGAITLRTEMEGTSLPVQHEGWDLAGEMKVRVGYARKEDA